MIFFAETFNFINGVGTVLFQLATLAIIVIWVNAHFGKSISLVASAQKCLGWIGERAVLLGFIVTGAALAGSLVYSEIIGFDPCKLCWIQRIFIYPQVLILGLALWKKTKDAATYCFWLSIIGLIVAAYHYYGQMFNPSALPCVAAGAGSCAVRFFVEFGYITIPLMSFSVFGLLSVLMFIANSDGDTRK